MIHVSPGEFCHGCEKTVPANAPAHRHYTEFERHRAAVRANGIRYRGIHRRNRRMWFGAR